MQQSLSSSDTFKSNAFKNNIKEFIAIENELKVERAKIVELKNHKSRCENDILEYIRENNLKTKDIIINNDKLRYFVTRKVESITKGVIEERLSEYFGNKEKGKELTEYIFTTRRIIEKPILQHVINKSSKNSKNSKIV
jgi:hypothetical protein